MNNAIVHTDYIDTAKPDQSRRATSSRTIIAFTHREMISSRTRRQ